MRHWGSALNQDSCIYPYFDCFCAIVSTTEFTHSSLRALGDFEVDPYSLKICAQCLNEFSTYQHPDEFFLCALHQSICRFTREDSQYSNSTVWVWSGWETSQMSWLDFWLTCALAPCLWGTIGQFRPKKGRGWLGEAARLWIWRVGFAFCWWRGFGWRSLPRET